MLYGVLAQVCPKKANVQGIGTFLYLLLTLTGGFIVYPKAIPRYWKWLFWANPMAWVIQGMASNQFLSSKYDGYWCYINGDWITPGESALENPRGWQSEGGRQAPRMGRVRNPDAWSGKARDSTATRCAPLQKHRRGMAAKPSGLRNHKECAGIPRRD